MEYWISINGEKEGPYTREQVLLKTIPPDTLVWHEGLTHWIQAAQLPELVSMFTPFEMRKAGVSPVPPPQCPPTYLVWAILSTLCCCQIFGIIAIIYAANVKTKYDRGDIDQAKKYSERAALWVILSFVVGLASIPLQIVFALL